MLRLVKRALATVGAGALLWTGYRAIAPEFVDVAPDRFSSGDGDEGPAEMLSGHLDVPLTEGNRIELLVNGDEIFPAMLSAIEAAEASINLLAYIYWRGQIARDFAAALSAAARRGVEVRVVLDRAGSHKMDEALIEQMESAGCSFAWFNPVRWYSPGRFNHRTHRRVMVIDGRIGFTGGAGIAEEWTGDAQDQHHWRDDHFRLTGPAVRYLQGGFAGNWRQATGEVLDGTRMFPPLEAKGDVRLTVINTDPLSVTSEIGFTYWLMFQRARERILLSTPYFVPDHDIETSLMEAARRGVDVQLLVPNEHQDSRLVRHASRTWYHALLDAGVRLYEYQPTMMHVKTASVDGDWALVGSANFDSRSIEINFEIAVAVFDPTFVTELDASFENDLRDAREITRDEVDGWSGAARARNHVARIVSDQL